jgi:hypothetical protein
VNIHVCEHATPVLELRRVWNTISQTLGFRTLEQFSGRDVWQLRVMLNALGHYRPGQTLDDADSERFRYTADVIEAVGAFRESTGLAGTRSGVPPGLVDAETVELLWDALARAGLVAEVRARLLDVTAVRR